MPSFFIGVVAGQDPPGNLTTNEPELEQTSGALLQSPQGEIIRIHLAHRQFELRDHPILKGWFG